MLAEQRDRGIQLLAQENDSLCLYKRNTEIKIKEITKALATALHGLAETV